MKSKTNFFLSLFFIFGSVSKTMGGNLTQNDNPAKATILDLYKIPPYKFPKQTSLAWGKTKHVQGLAPLMRNSGSLIGGRGIKGSVRGLPQKFNCFKIHYSLHWVTHPPKNPLVYTKRHGNTLIFEALEKGVITEKKLARNFPRYHTPYYDDGERPTQWEWPFFSLAKKDVKYFQGKSFFISSPNEEEIKALNLERRTKYGRLKELFLTYEAYEEHYDFFKGAIALLTSESLRNCKLHIRLCSTTASDNFRTLKELSKFKDYISCIKEESGSLSNFQTLVRGGVSDKLQYLTIKLEHLFQEPNKKWHSLKLPLLKELGVTLLNSQNHFAKQLKSLGITEDSCPKLNHFWIHLGKKPLFGYHNPINQCYSSVFLEGITSFFKSVKELDLLEGTHQDDFSFLKGGQSLRSLKIAIGNANDDRVLKSLFSCLKNLPYLENLDFTGCLSKMKAPKAFKTLQEIAKQNKTLQEIDISSLEKYSYDPISRGELIELLWTLKEYDHPLKIIFRRAFKIKPLFGIEKENWESAFIPALYGFLEIPLKSQKMHNVLYYHPHRVVPILTRPLPRVYA